MSRLVAPLTGPILVVSPHPDDEVLGAGGTIMWSTDAGAQATVLYVTDGSRSHERFLSPEKLAKIRRAEAAAASAALGAEPRFLDVPDQAVGDHIERIIRGVISELERTGATSMFTPEREDPHSDHAATTQAVLAAIARSGWSGTLLEYPLWYWNHWPAMPLPWPPGRDTLRLARGSLRSQFGLRTKKRFETTVEVDDLLERKRQALAFHRSQLEPLVDDAPHWPTLYQVGGGRWLESFFTGVERFAKTVR